MTTRPLRAALATNLVFSTLCAIALLFYGPAITQIMSEAIPPLFMKLLGFGLVGFAAFIGFVIVRLRLGWALVISAMDFLWVVSTMSLLFIPNLLTTDGKIIIVTVAVLVGLWGFLQMRGIKKIVKAEAEDNNTYRHCVILHSKAKPSVLWKAIRDLGAMSRYSPGLRSSIIEEDKEVAVGAVRVCTAHNDQSWGEEVVSLDDAARSVVLRFRTEAEDFPFPFASMVGGWSVKPASDAGSTVTVWWDVRPKQRRLGWLFLILMTIPIDRDIRRILAAMEAGGASSLKTSSKRLPALGYC